MSKPIFLTPRPKLIEYLDRIEANEPINAGAFFKLLPKRIRESWFEYFSVKAIDGQLSRVTPTDIEFFERLRKQAQPATSRVEASSKGDSHKHAVSKAYLMVFSDSGSDLYPEVVVLSGEDVYCKSVPKDKVLIIENEENFFAWKEMLAFVSHSLGRPDLTANEVDVIFAGGNRINKQVSLDWIRKQYSEVFCAFDYDLGGLTMFSTLKKTIDQAQFVMPKSWSDHKDSFRLSPETSPRLRSAIEKAHQLGFSELAEMFSSTRKFMEQEMLLTKEFKNDL